MARSSVGGTSRHSKSSSFGLYQRIGLWCLMRRSPARSRGGPGSSLLVPPVPRLPTPPARSLFPASDPYMPFCLLLRDPLSKRRHGGLALSSPRRSSLGRLLLEEPASSRRALRPTWRSLPSPPPRCPPWLRPGTEGGRERSVLAPEHQNVGVGLVEVVFELGEPLLLVHAFRLTASPFSHGFGPTPVLPRTL